MISRGRRRPCRPSHRAGAGTRPRSAGISSTPVVRTGCFPQGFSPARKTLRASSRRGSELRCFSAPVGIRTPNLLIRKPATGRPQCARAPPWGPTCPLDLQRRPPCQSVSTPQRLSRRSWWVAQPDPDGGDVNGSAPDEVALVIAGATTPCCLSLLMARSTTAARHSAAMSALPPRGLRQMRVLGPQGSRLRSRRAINDLGLWTGTEGRTSLEV